MPSLKKSRRISNRTLRKKRSPQSGGYNRDSGKNFISVNKQVTHANIISTPHPGISADALIREGTLFNCGVIWYRHRGVEYYIGVARSLTKLGDGVDGWAGTDIRNTTAGSQHSAWSATGWNGIDRPYLFITEKNLRDERRHTRFFGMNCFLQDYHNRFEIGLMDSNLEDPRIALCEGVLCFFAHTPYEVPARVSERGTRIPGAGAVIDLPGAPGAVINRRMKPVISWVHIDQINYLIDGYFGHGRTSAERAAAVARSTCRLQNADWRPLCANFVDTMDKNWGIIPRPDAISNRPEHVYEPAFDFLCQWGFFGAHSVVVLRHYLVDMMKPTRAANGGLDRRFHGLCDLTQSVGGWKFRRIARPQFSQSVGYNVPTNNRIRQLYDFIRNTCHTILSTFITTRMRDARGADAPAAANSPWWRARGQRGDPDRFKFDIILEAGNTFKVKYPFITSRRVEPQPHPALPYEVRELKSTISHDSYYYDGRQNAYVIGISTGGTMCQIGEEFLGVGHLKLNNELAYAVYVACLWYSENLAHKNTDFPGAAHHELREFLEFIVSPDSIFRRIYNFFQSQEVYNPRSTYYLPYVAQGADLRRRNRERNYAHNYLSYSSFLFKMERSSYKITNISAQFFFGVNPCVPAGGPRAQLLQFAHSIDVNDDSYIIGFGDNDARSWIGKMSRRIGNSLLTHPKNEGFDLAHPEAGANPARIDEPAPPASYFKSLARKFLSYCIIESANIEQ